MDVFKDVHKAVLVSRSKIPFYQSAPNPASQGPGSTPTKHSWACRGGHKKKEHARHAYARGINPGRARALASPQIIFTQSALSELTLPLGMPK